MPVDIAAVLTANIDEFKAKMAEADVSMKAMTDHGTSNMSKLQTIGKGAALGVGVALVGIGIASVKMGMDLQESQRRLDTAMRAAGESPKAYQGSLDKTRASLERLGFTNADVNTALANGVVATKSITTAQKEMSTAADLARFRHMGLADATVLLTRALAGNSRVLKSMGIDLAVPASNALKLKNAHDALTAAQLIAYSTVAQYGKGVEEVGNKHFPAYQKAIQKVEVDQQKLSDLQSAHTKILDELSRRLHGQAADAANTFAGRLQVMRAQGEDLAANLGTRLIPILERLMSVIMNVVQWFEKHRQAAIILGVAIASVLVPAILSWAAGMAVAAAETFVAMLPLMLIIAAVAALGVGIYELVTHWKQVWTDIKNWLDDAYQFIKAHFYLLMAIPLVGWMLALAVNWKTIWEGIKTAIQVAWAIIGPIFNLIKTAGIDQVQAAITVFRGIWNYVWAGVTTDIKAAQTVIGAVIAGIAFGIGAIESVVQGLVTIWNNVWSGLGGAVNAVWGFLSPIFGAMLTAIHGVTDAINGLETVASKVGGIIKGAGSAAGKVASFFGLASGGPVSADQPYIVGESGPELFIPSAAGNIIPNGGFGPTAAGGGGPGGQQGGGAFVVNLVVNGQTFAQAISNDMWTAFLQKKRSTVTLNLT